MVPEAGTDEQLQASILAACTPKPGECWHYALYGKIVVECIHHGNVQVRTDFKPVMTNHILLSNWHWMVSHGKLKRVYFFVDCA